MGDRDALALLASESDALAARRERAHAAIEDLRTRETAASDRARARQRILVALERRGIVGGSLLTLVGTQFMGFRMGVSFGHEPNLVNAAFALVMICLGAGMAFVGWRSHVKEQAMLARARASAERASLVPAPPPTRVADLDAVPDEAATTTSASRQERA